MSDDDRPKVHCIVAWWPAHDQPCIVRPRSASKRAMADGRMGAPGFVLTLEEAAGYADLGFQVLVDPFDMEALTAWEQRQRARSKRKFSAW